MKEILFIDLATQEIVAAIDNPVRIVFADDKLNGVFAEIKWTVALESIVNEKVLEDVE